MTETAVNGAHSWADEPEPEASQQAQPCNGSHGGASAGGREPWGGGRRGPTGMAKPPRPDDSETRAIIQKLQETIAKHKQRAEEITASIDAKHSGRVKTTPQQASIKSRLGELRTHLQQLLAQKQALRAQLDVATDAQERTRESLKQLKTGTRFTRVENIDEQIAELEARLAGSSVNLSGGGLAGEERQRVERQLSALQRSRSHVEELRRSASAKDKDTSTVDELRARAARLEEQIGQAREEEAGLRDQLAGFKAAEVEQIGDIPALIRERDECKAVCRAAYSKVQELRQALDAEWAAFKQANVAYHQQQVERRERHQEYLRRKAAREAAQEQRQQEQAAAGDGEADTSADGAAEGSGEGSPRGSPRSPPHGRANGFSGKSGRGSGRGGRSGNGGRGRGRGRGHPAGQAAAGEAPVEAPIAAEAEAAADASA